MSFIELELHSLAKEINKPTSSMTPFITVLEENWVDSQEAFLEVTEETQKELKIPLFLLKKMLARQEKLRLNQGTNQKQPDNKQPSNSNEMMTEEIIPKVDRTHLNNLIDGSYRTMLGYEASMTMLGIMRKLIENTCHDPKNAKKRVLNQANPKIKANIGDKETNIQFFQTLGWQHDSETSLVLTDDKFSFDSLNTGQEVIDDYAQKLTKMINGIGKSHTSGTTAHSHEHLQNKIGKMPDFGALINEEVQRRKALIVPIQNRRVTFTRYSKDNNDKSAKELSEKIMRMEEENQEGVPSSLNMETMSRLKAMFAGDEKFASKKQLELQKLLKSQVVTETFIKFKLWNEDTITAVFAPCERYQNLYDVVLPIIKQNYGNEAANNFYLFVTPPIMKLADPKHKNKTLTDMGFGSRALIRIGEIVNNNSNFGKH